MGQIVIFRNGQAHLDLVSRGNRTVVSASQNKAILEDDSVTLRVASNSVLDIKVNDYFEVFGDFYRINQPPVVKKNNERSYEYDIVGQGVMFDLLRCKFFNADGTGFKTTFDFPIIGNLQLFLTVVANNMKRFSPLWEVGTIANSTETKTITFNSDSCLSALQKICQEFKTEFWVKSENGRFYIHTGQFGSTLPITFQYGKGKGLYSLSRKNVDEEGIINRLYVEGGSENIPADYRNFSEKLKFSNEGYIEDSTQIALEGLKEGSIEFSDIYPHRTGVISSVTSLTSFTDNSMDFDLNEREADGISTKYLVPGQTAKMHFNSGNLAGYQFEIAKYNHATKTFTIIPFDNGNGQVFPDANSGAFQFQAGDEYVLLDIYMPESYITNSENELLAKGKEQFYLAKQAKVAYDLEIADDYLSKLPKLPEIGDLIHIVDSALGIDKVIRVNAITRDFIDGGEWRNFRYKVTIADDYEIAFSSQMVLKVQEVKNFQSTLQLQQKTDGQVARNAYQFSKEFADNIVDNDGYYKAEKIRPLSIETKMISLGSRMQQFSIPDVLFFIENNNTSLRNTAGRLIHLTVTDNGAKTWDISANTINGISPNFNNIYAKANKNGKDATFVVSESAISVDSDPNYYYFEVGYLSSIIDGIRRIKTTYGFAQLNPSELSIGKIADPLGNNYIELLQDKINIKASVTFTGDSPALSQVQQRIDTSASNLQGQVNNAQNTANTALGNTQAQAANIDLLQHKTDFLTASTVQGNAIATGSLIVGNGLGANAGITGLGGNQDIFLWGGSDYSNRTKAPISLSRDGFLRVRNSAGQVIFEIGQKNGKAVFNIYNDAGNLVAEIGQAGIQFLNYVGESYTKYDARKIDAAWDEAAIARVIKNNIKYTFIDSSAPQLSEDNDWQLFNVELVVNSSLYHYSPGNNFESVGNQKYIGFYQSENKLGAKVADGIYVLYERMKVYKGNASAHDPRVLYPVESGSTYYFDGSYELQFTVYKMLNGQVSDSKVITISGYV